MPAAVCRSGIGQFRYYMSLPAANDALVFVLLKQAGLQPFADIIDHTDLQSLLAASNNEVDALGYARQTSTSPLVVTFDSANNRVDGDVLDIVFPLVGDPDNPQNAGGLAVCYDPNTTTGADDTLLVLTYHDFRSNPEELIGDDARFIVPSTGLVRGVSG